MSMVLNLEEKDREIYIREKAIKRVKRKLIDRLGLRYQK